MCRWRSGHILRERAALCPLEGIQSHGANLNALGLPDTALPANALPIEITPTGCLTSTDPADWVVTIDLPVAARPDWGRGAGVDALLADAKAQHLHEWKAWLDAGNTKFGGNLDLCGTAVKSLGRLTQCGNLDLRESAVKSLGKLTQCGNLYLGGSAVKSLGRLARCGYLDLRGTAVKSLGRLTQCGDLDLCGNQRHLVAAGRFASVVYVDGVRQKPKGESRA